MTKLLALAILALFMTGCATGPRYDKNQLSEENINSLNKMHNTLFSKGE